MRMAFTPGLPLMVPLTHLSFHAYGIYHSVNSLWLFCCHKKTSELELELSLLAPMSPPFSRPQHSDFDLDLTKTQPESRWKICVPSSIWISPIIWSPIRNIQECTCWWLIIAQRFYVHFLTKLRLWILGDSQSIFPSLDKMWNFSSLQKLRKMTSLKQFIKLELMCIVWCALCDLCPFHTSTKVLTWTDLMPRPMLLLWLRDM